MTFERLHIRLKSVQESFEVACGLDLVYRLGLIRAWDAKCILFLPFFFFLFFLSSAFKK